MKKIIIKMAAACMLITGLGSCTSDYDNINTDPTAFTTLTNNDYAGLWWNGAIWLYRGCDYQISQGLYSDLYAQYFANTTTYFNTDRYHFRTEWAESLWKGYAGVMTAIPSLKTIMAKFDENTAEHAMALVCYVYGMLHLTDDFGPIPYEGAGEGEIVPYNDVKTVYHDMLSDLEKAATAFASASSNKFAAKDPFYKGDNQKWKKFTNTLRMRLAMRLADKEPDFAKQQFEAAYQAGGIDSNDDNMVFQSQNKGSFFNYLARDAQWNEFAMSSTIYSYLKGWNDPRLPLYFQPAAKSGKFASLRNGLPTVDVANDRNKPSSNSNIGPHWIAYEGMSPVAHLDASQTIAHACETYFLRAEAALRGWNAGGTAKDLYNKGITLSLKEWNVPEEQINSYITGTTDPAAPEDYSNSPAVAKGICVKYDAAASKEHQLQQIITQKWLGIFPDSFEAWAEIRRTGYPALYPVVESEDSDLPVGSFIQRMKYPDALKISDATNVENALKLLDTSGKDSQATKLYWAK